MATDTTGDTERIKEDLAKLREEFGDLFAVALDLGKHSAGSAREKLHAGVEELRKAAKHVQQRGEEAVEATQKTIAARPITSVLIAFGAGILLAKLLDRR